MNQPGELALFVLEEDLRGIANDGGLKTTLIQDDFKRHNILDKSQDRIFRDHNKSH